MKFLKMAALVLVLTAVSVPTRAAENYYNVDAVTSPDDGEESEAGTRSFTVTSIQKCYDQLPRADVLEIQRKFDKPYQECRRRLMLALKKKQEKILDAQKNGKTEEETPATPNYFRVQPVKNPVDGEKPVDSKDEAKPAK